MKLKKLIIKRLKFIIRTVNFNSITRLVNNKSENVFKEITSAYEVLSDLKAKLEYDKTLNINQKFTAFNQENSFRYSNINKNKEKKNYRDDGIKTYFHMDPNTGQFYKVTVKGGHATQEEYNPIKEEDLDNRFKNRNFNNNFSRYNHSRDSAPEEEVMIIKTRHIVISFICITAILYAYIYFLIKKKAESVLIIGKTTYYPKSNDPLLKQLIKDQKYDPTALENFTKRL